MGNFIFQAPGARKLLDELTAASGPASEGLGVFAFASSGGVQSFMDAIALGTKWKNPKKFHLIVGVDAVTNADALLKISDLVGKNKAVLSAEVFYHGNRASTFHPKFTIFRSESKLRLLAGSGNLTTSGLGEASTKGKPPGNWEAFSVQDFVGKDADMHWADAWDWINSERALGRLRTLSDPGVRSQALANALMRFTGALGGAGGSGGGAAAGSKKAPSVSGGKPPVIPKWGETSTPVSTTPTSPSPHAPELASASTVPLDSPALTNDLLIKELSSNRPGQADVGKQNLENFFGYEGETTPDILAQYVSLADEIAPARTIELFKNASNNFRVELSAVADFPYQIGSDDSRIIVVVARLAPRSFRYTVVPVNSKEYSRVSKLLGPIKPVKGRKMRGQTFPLEDLVKLWPGAPANLKPVLAHSPSP